MAFGEPLPVVIHGGIGENPSGKSSGSVVVRTLYRCGRCNSEDIGKTFAEEPVPDFIPLCWQCHNPRPVRVVLPDGVEPQMAPGS